jgi:hypothetical protein
MVKKREKNEDEYENEHEGDFLGTRMEGERVSLQSWSLLCSSSVSVFGGEW